MAPVASYHCVPSVDLHCPLSYFHRVEELQENSCCDISKEKRPKEFCFCVCVYDTYLYSVCTSIFNSILKRVIVMRDTLLKTAITPWRALSTAPKISQERGDFLSPHRHSFSPKKKCRNLSILCQSVQSKLSLMSGWKNVAIAYHVVKKVHFWNVQNPCKSNINPFMTIILNLALTISFFKNLKELTFVLPL